MQKTTTIKKDDQQANWYLLDAKNIRLGKLATTCASLLIGKHKTTQADYLANPDKVVVINAAKVSVHPRKLKNKKYVRHSTYRGGYKEATLEEMMEKFPERVIEFAVKGMLPKTKQKSALFNNLYVYTGSEHKHEAQKPVKIEID